MRTIQEVIVDLKQTNEWSQPNIKYQEFENLIEELERIVGYSEVTPIDELVPVQAMLSPDGPTFFASIDLIENVEQNIGDLTDVIGGKNGYLGLDPTIDLFEDSKNTTTPPAPIVKVGKPKGFQKKKI